MPHPHGTINRYNNQRCRCDACRAAIRDYRRERRATARTKQQRPIEHQATAGWAHLVDLLQTGLGTTVDRDARYQVVRASCGHELWFPATAPVQLGGWVRCPWHPMTGVREISTSPSIPRDAVPGMVLAQGST
jgi:hypothetical protein